MKKNMQYKSGLPSFYTTGFNMAESGFPCLYTSKDKELGTMILDLRHTTMQERRIIFIDGRQVMCSNNWVRDNCHQMKAYKHWEYDMKSFIDLVIDHQADKGFYLEFIKMLDEPHLPPDIPSECRIDFPEDNYAFMRLELEADVEYLVVESAIYIYQVTGDDEWIKKVLPSLEKAINYCTTDEKRWSAEYGLAKRPFTIDTWDFPYHDGMARAIDENTPMSIMHGDNSGIYQAMKQLEWLNRRFGNETKADEWNKRAEELKKNINKYLWNGKFYIHQLHLNHKGEDDRENERLSLSNSYDMNRGITDYEQNVSIINEYIERGKKIGAFAEWLTLDPPYERFPAWMNNHVKKGDYVNGGVAVFVAGELAKAAFRNGMEEYAYSILKRINDIYKENGFIQFTYHPHNKGGQQGGPSGWGSAAVLNAIDEGLAGIIDTDVQYRKMRFAPCWPVSEYDELRYITGYELGKVRIETYYRRCEDGLLYTLSTPSEEIDCHIYLLKDEACSSVTVNGKEIDYKETNIGESKYVDFKLAGPDFERNKDGYAINRTYRIEVGFD